MPLAPFCLVVRASPTQETLMGACFGHSLGLHSIPPSRSAICPRPTGGPGSWLVAPRLSPPVETRKAMSWLAIAPECHRSDTRLSPLGSGQMRPRMQLSLAYWQFRDVPCAESDRRSHPSATQKCRPHVTGQRKAHAQEGFRSHGPSGAQVRVENRQPRVALVLLYSGRPLTRGSVERRRNIWRDGWARKSAFGFRPGDGEKPVGHPAVVGRGGNSRGDPSGWRTSRCPGGQLPECGSLSPGCGGRSWACVSRGVCPFSSRPRPFASPLPTRP
jgi:hypothetical protein